MISIILFILSFALTCPALAQQQTAGTHIQHQTLMFWNVENAFWPDDDPLKQDDDFTPEGSRHWTKSRLRQKLTQLERVMLGAGGGTLPMVVGLAEVEGDSVMQYWLHHTALRKLGYRYILTDSSDVRGIQPALLYQPTDFRLLSFQSHSIALPHDYRTTRQLLHASGRLVNADTLDLIIAHLPSQYGGARQSDEARTIARQQLMLLADSIRACRLTPRIVIMGDMNEAPSRRHQWWDMDGEGQWINLMLPLQQSLGTHPSHYGSHKYQGEWSYLDQFIVPRSLLSADSLDAPCQRLCVSNARSYSLPFMLTADDTHLGQRPRRSFYGFTYEGGLSDHLPILLDLDVPL